MATKKSETKPNPTADFAPIFEARDPPALARSLAEALEAERRARFEADRKALDEDRGAIASALKEFSERAPPERLRRLAALAQFIEAQEKDIDEAVAALGKPAAAPKDGWLAIGRVREADGAAPKGAQVCFDDGAKMKMLVDVDANGEARMTLSAKEVAAIAGKGETLVRVFAIADGREIADVAPARIVANGVHVFDLALPPARPGPGARRRATAS